MGLASRFPSEIRMGSARELIEPVASNILVIVSDSDMRGMLKDYLTGEGYEVTTVSSADEVTSALGRGRFDVLVIDLDLPGVRAAELLQLVDSASPTTLVIPICDYDDGCWTERCLTRPFHMEELLGRIRDAL